MNLGGESRVAGAEVVAETGLIFWGVQCRLLQGLKPSIDLIGFIGLAKAMPCYSAVEFKVEMEFFRSL